MKQNIPTGLNLSTIQHKLLKRCYNPTAIASSAILGLLGGSTIYLSVNHIFSSNTIPTLLFTLGTVCVLLAIYRFTWKSHQTVYVTTGSAVKKDELFFSDECLKEIEDAIHSRNWKQFSALNTSNSGNAKIDFVFSTDRQFIGMQLFKYANYTYSPVSDVMYFAGDDAKEAISILYEKMKL